MATLKPTTPLRTPNKGPLKPPSPLRPKTAPKTPISHPQRRCRFQLAHLTGLQRRRWFQTTGPPGRQGQAAAPAGGPRRPRAHQAARPACTHNDTRPQPVSRPRPRHAHAVALSTAPPAIRRSCPRDPQPRRGQPRGGRRGRGTGSRTRSPGPRHGRSGSTAGRHRARHTLRA